jgi:hypothetical protein
MNVEKNNEEPIDDVNKFLPPPNRPDLPLVITNQWKPGNIKNTITSILTNPVVDTLVAVSPFISPFFVRMMCKTKLKNFILLINRDDLNPDYVKKAVSDLKNVPFGVIVRERPPKSKFVHMKVMIPYVRIDRILKRGIQNMKETRLEPCCAISGSVNFTQNGITISDELLFIVRDIYSINMIVESYSDLLKGSLLVYDSQQ